MSQPAKTCTGWPIRIDRRTAIIGAAAMATLLPFAGAHAGGGIRVADLIGDDGLATARAKALAGTSITLRGYLDPVLLPGATERTLTDSPQVPCQLCGIVHGLDQGLPVVTAAAADAISMEQLVAITGRLEVASDRAPVRIVGASVQTI
ncbi:MAG TPA: hypothetical protein VIM38_01940 [Alphaproteobacteria bacterium]